MLYDNGQLAQTFLDAYRVTGDEAYARVARGILDYLRRDMSHPDGGIFSAEVSCLFWLIACVVGRNRLASCPGC
jgi:uncharacterized protein YyaL (SSP411 family)